MNFSEGVKREILGGKEKTDGEKKAFVSAFLRSAGSLSLVGGKVGFEIATDNADGAKTFAEYFAVVYGLTVKISEENGRKKKRNVIRYDDDATEILDDLGVLEVDAEGVKLRFGVKWDLVGTDAEKAAFLRGAFSGGGSATLPKSDGSSSTGYHLEFVFGDYVFATDVCEILSELYFLPKLIQRKDAFIVYLKTRDEISDFLALMGASKAVLKLAEITVEKDMNNNYNRQLNCEMSNMSKQIDASVKQIRAIEKIDDAIGRDSLPNPLKTVADARINNRGLTLSELAEKLGISKSCLNHRLRKIVELADNL